MSGMLVRLFSLLLPIAMAAPSPPTLSEAVRAEVARRDAVTDAMINEVLKGHFHVRLAVSPDGHFVTYPGFGEMIAPLIFERARAEFIASSEEVRKQPSKNEFETSLLIASAKQFDAAERAFNALQSSSKDSLDQSRALLAVRGETDLERKIFEQRFKTIAAEFASGNYTSPLVYELLAAAALRLMDQAEKTLASEAIKAIYETALNQDFAPYVANPKRAGPFGQSLLRRLASDQKLSRVFRSRIATLLETAQNSVGALVIAPDLSYVTVEKTAAPVRLIVRSNEREARLLEDGMVELYDRIHGQLITRRIALRGENFSLKPIVRFEGRTLILENPETGLIDAYSAKDGHYERQIQSLDFLRRKFNRPTPRSCEAAFGS